MPQLILTLVLIAVGWFLIIRPQQARVREQRNMVNSLAVGDSVITAGGIHGEITVLGDETVQLLVAPGVELTVVRLAIGRKTESGSDDDRDVEAVVTQELDEGERHEEDQP